MYKIVLICFIAGLSLQANADVEDRRGVSQVPGPVVFASLKTEEGSKTYLPSDDYLAGYPMRGTPLEYFGSVLINSATGVTAIRESQYPLNYKLFAQKAEPAQTFADLSDPEKLKVGLRIIPVNDLDCKNQGNPEFCDGAQILDNELRKSLELEADNEYLFGMPAYGHPEEYDVEFSSMGKGYKPQFTQGHLAAYLGNGTARNAPFFLHDDRVMNYNGQTVNFTTVTIEKSEEFDSFSQAELNRRVQKNCHVTTRLMNEIAGEDLNFSPDYSFDWMHTVNMVEVFAHYRGWMDSQWVRPETDVFGKRPFIEYLKDEDVLATYCAEHVTIIVNTCLNLPQNLQGYQEVFGPNIGKDLFEKVKRNWAKISDGQDFPEVEYFAPLWKRDGQEKTSYEIGVEVLSKDRLDINDDMLSIYDTDENGQIEGEEWNEVVTNELSQLNPVDGPARVTEVGKHLAWRPQTTSDLIVDFLGYYANWAKVGAVNSSLALLGFEQEFRNRTGVAKEVSGKMLIPAMANILAAEIMTYLPQNEEQVLQIFDQPGSYSSALLGAFAQFGIPGEVAQSIHDNIRIALEQSSAQLVKAADTLRILPEEMVKEAAYRIFLSQVQTFVHQNRQQLVGDPIRDVNNNLRTIEPDKKTVQYYSPPAVPYKIATGVIQKSYVVDGKTFYNVHPSVEIQVLGTVLSEEDTTVVEDEAFICQNPSLEEPKCAPLADAEMLF